MIERGELRLNQVADLTWMMMQKKGILGHDPGVGKTPPVCTWMYYLAKELQVGSCWLMPKSLLKKNRDELLRFSEFEESDIVVLDGTKEQRDYLLGMKPAVFLMGFKRFTDDWKRIKANCPWMKSIVIDESHLGYTTWDSKNVQALAGALANGFEYFIPMTGSLIKGRLSSAFPMIHLIEPRYYGSEQGFMMHHAVRDEFGGIIGWQNHEKLGRILHDIGIRRTFVDEYGPEAKVLQLHEVDLDPVHREIYEEWHDKAMLELQDEYLTTDNPAVHALRARQLLAHPETFLLSKWGRKRETARDERLIAELEDVKHTGERYVLFSCFVDEIERLGRLGTRLGLRTGLLHGGITSPRRADTELAFRNGQLDLLVVNPTVAGIGYNWPFLNRLGFTSLDYGNDSFGQAYKRGIRGKREQNLLVGLFGYRNTVEWRVRSIIETKSRDANLVDPTYEILELNRLGRIGVSP